MAINPIIFDEHNVTSKNDGTLYATLLNDGVIAGCALTYTSTTITIGTGYFIAKGRVVQIPSTETITISDPLASGYIRVRAKIDLTVPATPVKFEYDQAASDSFAALTQEDINGSGNVYEIDFARGTLSDGNVTSVIAKLGASMPIIVPKRAIFILSSAYSLENGESSMPTDAVAYNDTGFSLDANKRLVLPPDHGYKWAKVWARMALESGGAAAHVLNISGTGYENGVLPGQTIIGSASFSTVLNASGVIQLKAAGGTIGFSVGQYSGSAKNLKVGSGWGIELYKY